MRANAFASSFAGSNDIYNVLTVEWDVKPYYTIP